MLKFLAQAHVLNPEMVYDQGQRERSLRYISGDVYTLPSRYPWLLPYGAIVTISSKGESLM